MHFRRNQNISRRLALSWAFPLTAESDDDFNSAARACHGRTPSEAGRISNDGTRDICLSLISASAIFFPQYGESLHIKSLFYF
jgi:hypothetical protein